MLLRYLVRERGATSFALVGHSTGCQDIVQFMKVADDDVRALVRVAVLQAPVKRPRGRDARGLGGNRAAMLKKAEAMIKDGRGDEIITLQYGFVRSPPRASRRSPAAAAPMIASHPILPTPSSAKSWATARRRQLSETRSSCTLWPTSTCRRTSTPALAARFVAAAGGPSTAEALLVPEASTSPTPP